VIEAERETLQVVVKGGAQVENDSRANQATEVVIGERRQPSGQCDAQVATTYGEKQARLVPSHDIVDQDLEQPDPGRVEGRPRERRDERERELASVRSQERQEALVQPVVHGAAVRQCARITRLRSGRDIRTRQ